MHMTSDTNFLTNDVMSDNTISIWYKWSFKQLLVITIIVWYFRNNSMLFLSYTVHIFIISSIHQMSSQLLKSYEASFLLFRFTDMKCLAKSEYYTRTSAELSLFDHLSHTITTYYLFPGLLSAFHLLQMQDAHYLTEFCLSVCELLCNRDARTVIFLI